MIKRILIVVFILVSLPAIIYADVSNYLILQDIGIYKLFTGITGRLFSGPPKQYSQTSTGGVLDAVDHFSENDVSYEASYTTPSSKWPFVKVEVTQHSGSDSDKWLLHEMEDGYRDGDAETLGRLTEGAILRKIGTNRVFWIGLGGGSFVWLSNDIVVKVSYVDLQGTKTEPLEVVQTYLQKIPSTISSTLLLDKAHTEQWIKDEMERRLWLCDKWVGQKEAGKVDVNKLLTEMQDHMKVFLNYKEKYYGIASIDEKNTIYGYMQAKDEAAMKTKLAEYKAWWAANKDGAITLP